MYASPRRARWARALVFGRTISGLKKIVSFHAATKSSSYAPQGSLLPAHDVGREPPPPHCSTQGSSMARCVKTPTKDSSSRQLSPLKAAQDHTSPIKQPPRRRLGGAGCFRRCAPPRTEGLHDDLDGRRSSVAAPPNRPTRRGSWTPSPPTTNSRTRRRGRVVGLDGSPAGRRREVGRPRLRQAALGLDDETTARPRAGAHGLTMLPASSAPAPPWPSAPFHHAACDAPESAANCAKAWVSSSFWHLKSRTCQARKRCPGALSAAQCAGPLAILSTIGIGPNRKHATVSASPVAQAKCRPPTAKHASDFIYICPEIMQQFDRGRPAVLGRQRRTTSSVMGLVLRISTQFY